MNILVTGIVGSGKTEFVENGVGLWNGYADEQNRAAHRSLGELYKEAARSTFGATEERAAMLEPTAMAAINANLLERAIVDYELHKGGNTVIETSLTLLRSDLRAVLKFSMERLKAFSYVLSPDHHKPGLNHIICLTPSVKDVKEHIKKENLQDAHPDDDNLILGWIAMEVMVSQILADSLGIPLTIMPPKYGMPPEYSRDKNAKAEFAGDTLAKILFDDADKIHDLANAGWNGRLSPEIYLAQPISSIKNLEKKTVKGSDRVKSPEEYQKDLDDATKLRRMISEFRARLGEHAIIVNPIELDDNERTSGHQWHTFHRDLYWFVHNTDMTVAYFPEPEESRVSIGVNRELSEAVITGKPFVFIAQGRNDLEKPNPFSALPPLNCRFADANKFFETVMAGKELPRAFKRLITAEGRPRYEKLMRHVQAR